MPQLFALLVGVGMGVLIQRVGASSPSMILKNLRLENLSVIKFMATTIAVGAIVSYGLSAFVPMHFVKSEESQAVKFEHCVVNHVMSELDISCLA